MDRYDTVVKYCERQAPRTTIPFKNAFISAARAHNILLYIGRQVPILFSVWNIFIVRCVARLFGRCKQHQFMKSLALLLLYVYFMRMDYIEKKSWQIPIMLIYNKHNIVVKTEHAMCAPLNLRLQQSGLYKNARANVTFSGPVQYRQQ